MASSTNRSTLGIRFAFLLRGGRSLATWESQMQTRALPRILVRSAAVATAVVLLGACSSSGSGYNPFDTKGDSRYEKDYRRQPGQEPARNPSDIEQRRRGGQDSG